MGVTSFSLELAGGSVDTFRIATDRRLLFSELLGCSLLIQAFVARIL